MVRVPLQVNAFTASLLTSYASCGGHLFVCFIPFGCLGREGCWSAFITSLSVDVTMIPKDDLNIVFQVKVTCVFSKK